ncbi:hypothetical protein [Erysipelothrix tonsillarum]|uniref:hypothetical protein n=1 Tax=Erysipelothrix tonsillarum TaxID=38402 RepID=UPI0039C77FFB
MAYNKSKYNELRKQLSREQARNVKKTYKEHPELRKFIESVDPSLSQPKKKTRKRSAIQKEASREAGLFKRFVKSNPGMSARQAQEQFRSWGKGHKISSRKAGEIYRDVHNQPKQKQKITKAKTYGVDNNPGRMVYRKGRYNYVMEYQAVVSGPDEDSDMFQTMHMTIVSDTLLTPNQRKQRVIRAYNEGIRNRNDYYLLIALDEDSIRTLYIIDTHKASKKFLRFEESYLKDNPGARRENIAVAYRMSLKER